MREIQFVSDDVAYRFEGLACAVFGCVRYQDPFGIATQDAYHSFMDGSRPESRRPLLIVLNKMVFDSPKNQKLKELEERAWLAKSQEDFNQIIDEAIEIYEAGE